MNITRPIASLKKTAANRKPGYFEECLRIGKVSGDLIEFTPEQHADLRARFAMPTVGQMLKTGAAAIGQAAQSMVAGERLLRTAPEIEAVQAICRACTSYLPAQGRCSECGCFSKWKARLTSWHCPLNPPKW